MNIRLLVISILIILAFSCSNLLERQYSELHLEKDMSELLKYSMDSTKFKAIIGQVTISSIMEDTLTGKTYGEILALSRESGLRITNIGSHNPLTQVEIVGTDSLGMVTENKTFMTKGKILEFESRKTAYQQRLLSKLFGEYVANNIDSLNNGLNVSRMYVIVTCGGGWLCDEGVDCIPGHYLYYGARAITQYYGPFPGPCKAMPTDIYFK